MLFKLNLIEALTGLEFGFLPDGDNTVVAGPTPHKTGSQITQEFDKVTFVELRRNTALYMEVDDNKDVVVSVGPWRMLAFINNNAGSGVDKQLRQMKEYREINNLILVPASGDAIFNDIKKACEADEKKKKATEPEFKTEPRKRKRQARGDSDFKPTAERLSESDDKRPSESTTTAATVASTESLFDSEELASIFKDIEEAKKATEPEFKTEPRKRKRQARGDSDFKPISESAATVIPLETIDDTEKLMNFVNDIMGSSEDDEEEEEEVTTPEPTGILDIEEDDD